MSNRRRTYSGCSDYSGPIHITYHDQSYNVFLLSSQDGINFTGLNSALINGNETSNYTEYANQTIYKDKTAYLGSTSTKLGIINLANRTYINDWTPSIRYKAICKWKNKYVLLPLKVYANSNGYNNEWSTIALSNSLYIRSGNPEGYDYTIYKLKDGSSGKWSNSFSEGNAGFSKYEYQPFIINGDLYILGVCVTVNHSCALLWKIIEGTTEVGPINYVTTNVTGIISSSNAVTSVSKFGITTGHNSTDSSTKWLSTLITVEDDLKIHTYSVNRSDKDYKNFGYRRQTIVFDSYKGMIISGSSANNMKLYEINYQSGDVQYKSITFPDEIDYPYNPFLYSNNGYYYILKYNSKSNETTKVIYRTKDFTSFQKCNVDSFINSAGTGTYVRTAFLIDEIDVDENYLISET